MYNLFDVNQLGINCYVINTRNDFNELIIK